MKVEKFKAPGLMSIEFDPFRDERGFFLERYNQREFEKIGISVAYLQDNWSRSEPGVLRGLHYQFDPPQQKLVGAIRGRIFDVALDLRPQSPTFGEAFGVELSDENFKMLWIPNGFAHGFLVLGDEPADVLYKTDAFYSKQGEAGIAWNDPCVKSIWPKEPKTVSQRDSDLFSFEYYQKNIPEQYRELCIESDRANHLPQ